MSIQTAAVSPRVRARWLVDGRLVVTIVLALYFLGLFLWEWHWPRFGVPGGKGFEFLDWRFWTTAWDCTRAGIEVDPVNACDEPRHRLIDHPRLWLAPAVLGLGEESTVVLGAAIAVLFFACIYAVMGEISPWDGLVYAALLCSPSVMLGVERGNPDLIVFTVLVTGIFLLHSRARIGAGLGHGLLLLAAFLKLYPVLAWGVLLRRPLTRAAVGGGALVVAFAVYVFVTREHLRAIRETLPRELQFSYGASVLAEGSGFGVLEGLVGQLLVLGLGCCVAAGLAALFLLRGRGHEEPVTRDLDAFWAGAGIYVGSFAITYNFNYRLIFLLLAVPQLLRWSREPSPLVPYARVGLSLILLALWFGTSLSFYPLGLGDRWERLAADFPYDELVNLALFAYLVAALVVTVPSRLSIRPKPAGT